MKATFEDTLVLMSNRNVPYVLVDGAVDEPATVGQILRCLGLQESGAAVKELVYTWDCVNGLEPTALCSDFKAAEELLVRVKATNQQADTQNPMITLMAINRIAAHWASGEGNKEGYGAVFVFFTGDRVLDEKNEDFLRVVQTMMNMREALSDTSIMVVMVGIEFNVPPELKEHIRMVQSPMPSKDEISRLVDAAYGSYNENFDTRKGDPKFEMTEDDRHAFTEALNGISNFQVNQNLYLSMDNQGIHLDRLRENAVQTINKTKGLSVAKSTGRGFDGLGGLYSLKDYMRMLLAGRMQPKTILFVDEIEKGIAGSGGGGGGQDTSGVSGNMLGTILTEMVETRSLGLLTTGVYGCGKSAFAKAFGEEANAITIHLDIAGMKDSLVGSSEANLRQAMKVIRALGGDDGGILWIATCNRIQQLPPELKSRFGLGTYFFDLPKPEERAIIWRIYLDQYEFPDTDDYNPSMIDDTDWSGREIEACCRLAWLMKQPLHVAAKRITPVALTARDEIQSLRREASGVFLDATHEGLYDMHRAEPRTPKAETKTSTKKVTL